MPFSPSELEMFRIWKMRTKEEADKEFQKSVARSVIDLHLDSVQKSLDLFWVLIVLSVVFWLLDAIPILGCLIAGQWVVNLLVKQYIRHRLNSR